MKNSMPYKDPEQQKAAQRKHYIENKDLYIKRGKQWKKDNPEKLKESKRKSDRLYKKKNPDRVREAKSLSRNCRKHAPILVSRDGNICGICKKSLNYLTEPFEIDHILPRKHGGTNNIENLQLSHPICNRNKGDKILSHL